MANWFEPGRPALIDSPALLVFPDRVEQNIQTAISMIGDVNRLRPHVKTNKSPEAVGRMMRAGITRFKCASIAEADMLGECNAPDVLLAYQLIGPKLQRFVSLVKRYPDTLFSSIVDNLETAEILSKTFSDKGLSIDVYLDIDAGMNRTGILPGDKAIELYSFLHQAAGINAAGLHVYDGHIRHPDIAVRKSLCDEAFDKVWRFKEELEGLSLPVKKMVVGGSPSFPVHSKRPGIECSPGTFIYWDKGYSDGCPEQGFKPAVVLMTRVVSVLSPTRICTDLGHKSVAAENELTKRIFFLNASGLTAIGQSEEHLVLESAVVHSFKPGDILYGLPYHVCPTVALYERAIAIEEGEVSGEWMNRARDRFIHV